MEWLEESAIPAGDKASAGLISRRFRERDQDAATVVLEKTMKSFRKIRIGLLRLVFIPIGLVVLFMAPSWSESSTMDYFLEYGGYVILLAGVAVRLWSVLYIGQRKSRELVTTGPYSLCRNPLYLGTIAVVVGIAMCLENPVVGILALAIFVVTHVVTTFQEERHLGEIFGQRFWDYKARVPRFLFSIRNYSSPDRIEVPIHAVKKAAMETCVILLIIPLAEVIERLHASHIIPVFWQFP